MFLRKVVLYGKRYINYFFNRLCAAKLITILETMKIYYLKFNGIMLVVNDFTGLTSLNPAQSLEETESGLCFRYY